MPDGKAPWPNSFRPDPGNFADMLVSLAAALGTAGPALVGTATTSVYLPVPRSRTLFVCAANMTGAVAYAGGSTVTATLIKKSGGTDYPLTAAYDLKSAISGDAQVNVAITGSDAACTLAPGDTLRWDVAAATTITTTGDLRAVVECAVVK